MKPVLALLLLSALPVFAMGQERQPGSRPAQLTLEDLRTFTDVFEQLRSNYVEEIDDRTLLHAAIRGMTSELDPYSDFIEKDEFQILDDASRGRFGGIGADIVVDDGRLRVAALKEDGAAAAAGVREGDLITAIDGTPVRGRRLAASFASLRGEPGSETTLRVRTPGQAARVVTITRQQLDITSVEGDLLLPRPDRA